MEKVSLWAEELEGRPFNAPEADQKNELSQQNKNLRLLSPIYQIEQNKGKLGDRTESTEIENSSIKNIDTVYLSILTLEYYASYALSHDSTPANDVIEYLLDKALLMNPCLTTKESRRIAEWVHNSLCNQLNDYKQFNFTYYDAIKHSMQRYEFRLIKIVSAENGHQCKITEEGITALLTYINANPKLQDEITSLLTQRLIKAGRYEEALQMAERSRKIVIQYQEEISREFENVRRDPQAGKISETVLPVINKSSRHVSDRIKEEDLTLDNISELQQEKLDKKAKNLVIKLTQTIKGNLQAYRKLYNHIDNTHKKFESTFRSLLRPSTSILPNIVNDLLESICQWPIEQLSINADQITNQIMPAKTPKLFDVMTLLDKLDSAGDHHTPESQDQIEADMEDIDRITPLFPEEMIDACKIYYQQKIEKKQSFTLLQLLEETEKNYFSDEFQRCLAYVVVMSFADNESIQSLFLDINITKQGRFQHHFITGDNLSIKNRNNQ